LLPLRIHSKITYGTAASDAALETRWWVKIAACVSIAVTSDEVHADGDAVVAADVDVRRRMRVPTVVWIAATPATQELTADLTRRHQHRTNAMVLLDTCIQGYH